MTSLFIGGCADGYWVTHSEDATYWQVVEPLPPPHINDNVITPDKMFAPDRHTYRRERLGAPGKTWTVFVHEPLGMIDAMNRLLDNYKP